MMSFLIDKQAAEMERKTMLLVVGWQIAFFTNHNSRQGITFHTISIFSELCK